MVSRTPIAAADRIDCHALMPPPARLSKKWPQPEERLRPEARLCRVSRKGSAHPTISKPRNAIGDSCPQEQCPEVQSSHGPRLPRPLPIESPSKMMRRRITFTKFGDSLARRLQIEPTPKYGSVPSRAFSTSAVLSPAAPLRRGLCCCGPLVASPAADRLKCADA